MAVALVIGLLAIAVGAHQMTPGARLTSWHSFGVGALIFGVCGAFFANACGGWVAGKIAGIMHAEPAILHGAIVWMLTLPALVILAVFGAGGFFGAWGGGLAGTPGWVTAAATANPQAAIIARNEAMGALLGILIGLIGAVVGAWVASGEPLRFNYKRPATADEREQREYVSTGGTVRVTTHP